MTGSRSAIGSILGLLFLCLGSAAHAQDLWEGKSPEQLFRLNCSACHKSPAGLATAGQKAGGLFGLESFLAQHYTASGRSAGLIANYLKAVDSAAQQRSQQPRRRASKPRKPAADKADTASSGAGKPDEKKAGEGKAETPKADAAAQSTDEKSEAKVDKPATAEPKPEKADAGAADARDDKNSKTTGNKPGGAADKKTN